MVVAVDQKNNVVSSSKIVHVATKGSKKCANCKKLIVKSKVNKKGKEKVQSCLGHQACEPDPAIKA